MPKYKKKIKDVDAHQHIEGEDWTKAESWVQGLIEAERLVIGDFVTIPYPDGIVITVHPTDWIILDPSGAIVYMTNVAFQDMFEQGSI